MAKKIIWTLKAQKDRKEILRYWRERNKSNNYSIKLNHLFVTHINIIRTYPNIGIRTTDEHVRLKIVKDYLIFYESRIDTDNIVILTIWDSRRDPDQLKLI